MRHVEGKFRRIEVEVILIFTHHHEVLLARAYEGPHLVVDVAFVFCNSIDTGAVAVAHVKVVRLVVQLVEVNKVVEVLARQSIGS